MTNQRRQVYRLVNSRTSAVVVEDLEIADGFLSRFAGLQLRSRLPAGHGLMLVPCSSIHTCFMRFALDLVMVDKQGRVLQVSRAVKPWRALVAPSQTHAVIEVTAGFLPEVQAGDRLILKESGGQGTGPELPKTLRFLAG
jgi:hypothetical protein